MALRRIVISEQFGIYKVEASGQNGGHPVTGGTLEKTLGKMAITAPDDYVLKAAQVLEPLLGPKSDGGGQIHTGIDAA